ncbi:Meiotically up-regulated gene 178 protein [Colletotrichum sidae]|uniref:Meiotically up-regulated gene 178 protein n=2 Tax=Colletotrichum orbiculare species complex TaxID=2707354 RepID=N4V5S9_COLOR|nr:Meiotically up-regulated gene 178 protein [Colletotrichum orbiculare MAFF 240422]TEA10805.1 Meiotically up-regulated gene 178 protein [Colletotrichum sidae]
MSSRLSPGGALLRSSRMFSVPKPLPQPGGESALVARYNSPSATTPYPTHQAITTPETSRILGDWGFKRSLPIRETSKSSTPAVRIKEIDSYEKVTDYNSAANHAISLQKFHELSLPISLPSPKRSRLQQHINIGHKSVFEDDADFTASGPGRSEEKRWKFKGPWLAGLTQGQFDAYLRKSVRNKREEFRQFVKERLAKQKTALEHQKALDSGEEMPQQVLAQDITEEELTEQIRKLRSDRIALYNMISEFLDLAPLNPPSSIINFTEAAERTLRPNLYAENGPPTSHPSAGISYLRTGAFAENHPVYGPQAHKTPVLARIVSPRTVYGGAKLGVGGFITDVPQGETAFNVRSFRGAGKGAVAGVSSFDPDIKGGAKSYVQPASARVDSTGSVVMTVNEANEEAQLVYRESVGKAKIYNDRTEPEPQVEPRRPFASMSPWSGFRTFTPAPNHENSQDNSIDLS